MGTISNGQFPLIAIIAGGAVMMLIVLLYQFLYSNYESSPDPFRQRSLSQENYMRNIRARNLARLWWETRDHRMIAGEGRDT